MDKINIPYGKQFISDDDIDSVVQVLRGDYLTQGPKIQEFETAFAQYVGAKYAVALSNGTAALHLCAMALGVNNNSKVITTPITFAASANCVRYCGGEVVFADIDPKTALLDIESVRKILESQPKGTFQGIIPVDFAGSPINLEEYRKLADEFNCWIIEDACHSPGGYFIDSTGTQSRCGSGEYADLAIFSFHPVKHIATGEGGMITTNRKDLYEKLLTLRTHGITKDISQFVSKSDSDGLWYMEMQELGYNYRISDINAALGLSQLGRADAGLSKRRAIAKRYEEAFKNSAIKSLENPIGHAYHLYVIQISNRLGLYNYLRDNQIFAQVHYIPVHTMPYYQNLGWTRGVLPNSENYYVHCLSLPMYPTLTTEEQNYVIEKILSFIL